VNVIAALCLATRFALACYKHATNSGFFENWVVNCLLKEIPRGYTMYVNLSRVKKTELRQPLPF
jgi:hypothetical protein